MSGTTEKLDGITPLPPHPDTMNTPTNIPATPQGKSGSHGTHAKLNASGAKCWMNCTAAPGYIEDNFDRILPIKVGEVAKLASYLADMPPEEVHDYERRAVQVTTYFKPKHTFLSAQAADDVMRASGSVAAREGTRAHDYAEAILRERKTFEDIPEEFRDPVGIYVDHCREITPLGVTPMIESRVPLFYAPSETGTVDFAVVDEQPDHTRITIRDYKHGAGVLVNAEDNEQLAIYALGLVNMLEGDPDMPCTFNVLTTIIDIGIVQPRHHEGDTIKTWVLTLNDLRRFCYDIGLAAKLIADGDVAFAPGEDACRWCDAKAFCEARSAAMMEGHSSKDSDGVDFLSCLPDLTKDDSAQPVDERLSQRRVHANEELCMPDSTALVLTDERVLAVFANIKAIKSWLGDIEEYVENRCLAGDDFGGAVKLVLGRQGNSEWKDEKAAETFLRGQGLKEAERFNYKLKSPTQAKDILGDRMKVKRTASRFAELVGRSDAKPVVALASDKRAAIVPSVNLLPEFGDTNDEEGMG